MTMIALVGAGSPLAVPTARAQVLDRQAAAKEGASFVVVDVATGKVLAQNKADERRYPASTTKLMTAYLALKALREEKLALDSPVVVSRAANSQAPSKMGFAPGTVIRLDQALRMMLVKSANDIAYAIGQTVGGGSMDTFVGMMNAAVDDLGMTDSHFVNPNGLPQDGQYSSAKDLAILARAIRTKFPSFSDYFGTEAISSSGHVMKNGNKLLGQFDGADGMKTGYICAAGFNLVSSATRDGRTLVAVVMGANGTIERERLSAEILTKGFATDPAKVTETIDGIPPSKGLAVDISNYICSGTGRTDRANERVEEGDRDEKFGSPYMHAMGRDPVVFPVRTGGAAGTDTIPAGISMIQSYGIPVPSPRPNPPELDPDVPDGAGQIVASAPDVDPKAKAGPGETATGANDANGADGGVRSPVDLSFGSAPDLGNAAKARNAEIAKVLSTWAHAARDGDGAAPAEDPATASGSPAPGALAFGGSAGAAPAPGKP